MENVGAAVKLKRLRCPACGKRWRVSGSVTRGKGNAGLDGARTVHGVCRNDACRVLTVIVTVAPHD
jgi:hypothetical protein